MTREELTKMESMITDISKLEDVCDLLKSHIDTYEENPTKMTGFDLTLNGSIKKSLNDEEVKGIYSVFRTEADKLTKELRQII